MREGSESRPNSCLPPSSSRHSITSYFVLILDPAELEAIRLIDLEGLSQEEAGERMGVSRGTVWRLLKNGRRKVATALSEGRAIAVFSAPEELNKGED
ncbi:MAG: DUF134 domain-containing protein [Candidatus Methanoglobus sp.]